MDARTVFGRVTKVKGGSIVRNKQRTFVRFPSIPKKKILIDNRLARPTTSRKRRARARIVAAAARLLGVDHWHGRTERVMRHARALFHRPSPFSIRNALVRVNCAPPTHGSLYVYAFRRSTCSPTYVRKRRKYRNRVDTRTSASREAHPFDYGLFVSVADTCARNRLVWLFCRPLGDTGGWYRGAS